VQQPEKGTSQAERTGTLHLPAPTVWPMVLALGISLCMAGLVTSGAVSLLGLILAVMATAGWFRNVLPHEQQETVHVTVAVRTAAAEENRPAAVFPQEQRGPLPLRVEPLPTYSFIAGIEGGLAGGAAMAAAAMLFGLVKYRSAWYAVNLLAAAGFSGWTHASNAFLSQFHPQGLLAAAGIHFTVSVLVGLLYGAALPMFPRRPVLTAGVLAPLLWTGLAYKVIGSVSPILSGRADWGWFAASQVAFGLTACFAINLRVKVRSAEFQSLPFATRAGLHTDRARRGDSVKDEDKR
jgi:hypothetical protein